MISISRRKLADSVIDEIKGMIDRGDLKEGDKLPNQNDFAAQLGVSRTVLREALQILDQLGVIEQRPKYGTVIRAKAALLYSAHLIPPLISDNRATLELIQARRIIEVGSAELAAVKATGKQIKEMGTLVEDMAKMQQEDDAIRYTEKNIAFHLLIAKASHNRFMVHLLVTIRGFMEQWTQESLSVIPGLMDRSSKYHKAIFEAIRDKNPRKAGTSMKKHMSDFLTSLERYYKMTGRKERNGKSGNQRP
ncbi:MAG: FadR family transcriptional regulator [Desulfobacteraceae bacterium]|nr:FadR family transcriptional regulator [Desulfobacteraceae bacterium]